MLKFYYLKIVLLQKNKKQNTVIHQSTSKLSPHPFAALNRLITAAAHIYCVNFSKMFVVKSTTKATKSAESQFCGTGWYFNEIATEIVLCWKCSALFATSGCFAILTLLFSIWFSCLIFVFFTLVLLFSSQLLANFWSQKPFMCEIFVAVRMNKHLKFWTVFFHLKLEKCWVMLIRKFPNWQVDFSRSGPYAWNFK